MVTDSLEMMRGQETGTQGIMITRRQDNWRIHKVWKVVMLKVDPGDSRLVTQDDTSDSEHHFMTKHCKVLPIEEVDSWIIAKLEQVWDKIDISSLSR